MNRPVLQGLRVLHVQKAHGLGGSERHICDLCAGLRAAGADARILWLADRCHPLDGLLALCRDLRIPAAVESIRGDLDPRLLDRLAPHLAARPVVAGATSVGAALTGTMPARAMPTGSVPSSSASLSGPMPPPDLLHLHLFHATFYGVLAARGRTIPVVATRHSSERYQRLPWFRLLARMLDRRCARVIVPSAYLAGYTRRWDGTPREKLRLIPHGIDAARFRRPAARRAARDRWGVAPDAIVIGSTSRLHPSKDLGTLLRAFAPVCARHEHVHLVLVGGGPSEASLRRLARRALGAQLCARRVHFAGESRDAGAQSTAAEAASAAPRAHRDGPPPADDVAGALAGFDVAVLPGLREGFGLAALEAMAAGLPVVATRAGALPELIADGDTGLLVPPRDASALAAALERLIAAPRLRREMGARAERRAAEYPAERMIAETIAVYEEALAPRHPRA